MAMARKLGVSINPKLHVAVLTGAGTSWESGVPMLQQRLTINIVSSS
jgi:NAD-dependent SIR2 family protein deacetylase